MFESRNQKAVRKLLVYCLLPCAFCLLAPEAHAVSAFGDIGINVKSEPKGQASHGYSEYVFTVANRSTERAHVVTLVIPQEAMGSRYEDYIRAVSRTVQVEPKTTVQVVLLHPDYPSVGGGGLKVIIDGREQEGGVPVTVASGHASMARGYGYGRRGRPYYGMKTAAIPTEPLVLVSQRVGEKFQVITMGAGGPPGIGPGFPLPPPGSGGPGKQIVRSEEPVGSWSPRWLSYSRYDGVVLTRDELEGLARGPADSQAIRTALIQYVEAGGALLVLDAGALTLPGSWKRNQETRNGTRVSHGGFGLCLQIDNRDTRQWHPATWLEVTNSWSQTATPYQNQRTLTDANAGLPIIDDLGLPVRGLFVLMLLFTIGIGPCNIWLLARWKRRIWLLWTVPLISLFTCAAVFGYMIVAEGWQGRTRVTAFTLLDENEQRAITLGRSASYSPLTPGDGLRFSQDTEVTVEGLDGSGGSVAVCDIDWTTDQHLRRGWMSARVPAQFQLRRSEVRRLERLPVTREANGSLHVTNQLGASIRNLWLADEKGKIYTAGAVNVGQSAALTPPGNTPLAVSKVGDALRRMYATTEWASLGGSAKRNPKTILAPRMYLAEIESSPFLVSGLAGAVVRPTESYVLGIMADE